MKQNLKPCVYKHTEHHECDVVLFVERSGELIFAARLSISDTEPKGNRVLIALKLHVIDPKPGDLSMCRLKLR